MFFSVTLLIIFFGITASFFILKSQSKYDEGESSLNPNEFEIEEIKG